MLGEIRSLDTAATAIRAALTGHLVFSTLHTNNAAGAAVRLVDMGIEPFLVASALRGVVAQRLVRCICPHCKTAYAANAEEKAYLNIKSDDALTLYKGSGCEKMPRNGLFRAYGFAGGNACCAGTEKNLFCARRRKKRF